MNETTEELFCDLLELPPGERVIALEAMTGLNAAMKAQVLCMLREAEEAEAYFTDTSIAVKIMPNTSCVEGEGDMCGPYKLRHKLGEGGFGVVWLAEQERPLKRTVAVKVIKPGMDTDEVLARFDAEKHALARMDHPNISKVLDAGMTELGRPYFVMELVEGKSITRYCEDKNLTLQDRLRLFVDVCSAVNHAHQKGVIHRDIKPSNVIVTEIELRPVVKVIDFGIAKAIEGSLTDHTLRTKEEQWLGTPVHMSPEQAGLGSTDVDTRSDIYALGVLLYELITGETPFDSATLMQAGYEEMRRIIREVEPPKPSVRLVKADRGFTTAGQNSRMPGDLTVSGIASELDWIVMKAIEKSRDRRYATAFSFADDIERFLKNEPVSARPPSTAYLLTKFAHRHRSKMIVIVAIAIIMIAAVIFSTLQAMRARKAEALAISRLNDAVTERNAKDRALQDAEAVTRLLSEVFRRTDPEVDGRKVMVADALDAATAKLDDELNDHPARHAMLLETLADTYEKLGIMPKSIELRRKAISLIKSYDDGSLGELLKASSMLVSRLGHVGNYEEARDLAAEEFRLRVKHHGLYEMMTLESLKTYSLNTFRSGDHSKAIDLQEQLVRAMMETPQMSSQRLFEAKEQLFDYCIDSGDMQREKRYSQELGRETKIGQPAVSFEERRNKLQKSLERKKEELLKLEKELGEKNAKTIQVRANCAAILAGLERFDEALEVQKKIINDSKYVYGELHPKTLDAIDTGGDYANEAIEWGVALKMRREGANIRKLTLGLNHYDTLRNHVGSALASLFDGRAQVGIEIANKHTPEIKQVMGSNSRSYNNIRCNHARCLTSVGRSQEAIPILAECTPHMLDDTFVNMLYGSLLLWNGEEGDYEALRVLIFDFWKEFRTRIRRQSFMVDRCALLCSLTPLKTQDQLNELSQTLAKAEEIFGSPNYQTKFGHGPVWSKTVYAIVNYRLGNFEMALKHLDEAQKLPDAAVWEKSMDLIFRPMILHAMGRTQEAKRLFLENTKSLRLWSDHNEPLIGTTDPSGIELTTYLFYKEAAEIFDVELTK